MSSSASRVADMFTMLADHAGDAASPHQDCAVWAPRTCSYVARYLARDFPGSPHPPPPGIAALCHHLFSAATTCPHIAKALQDDAVGV